VQQSKFRSVGMTVAGVGAAAWIALGLESILRPVQDNRRDAVWMIPFLFTVASFWFIHAVQSSSAGKFERVTYWLVMISSALVFLGNNGLVFNIPLLQVLGFPLGAILWTIGTALFGAGTIRARVLPRFAGLVLIVLEPCSILTGLVLSPIAPLCPRGAYSGGVEKGAMLALIAYAFFSMQNTRRTQAGLSEA
jgi:hypothetical protein